MLNFVFALREELFKLFSNKKISTSRKLTIYLNVCSELQDVLNSEEFVTEDKDYKNLIKDTIDNVTFDVKHKPAYKDDISAEIEEILMAFFEVPDMEEEYEEAHTKLEKLIAKKYPGKKIIKAFRDSLNGGERQEVAPDDPPREEEQSRRGGRRLRLLRPDARGGGEEPRHRPFDGHERPRAIP